MEDVGDEIKPRELQLCLVYFDVPWARGVKGIRDYKHDVRAALRVVKAKNHRLSNRLSGSEKYNTSEC